MKVVIFKERFTILLKGECVIYEIYYVIEKEEEKAEWGTKIMAIIGYLLRSFLWI